MASVYSTTKTEKKTVMVEGKVIGQIQGDKFVKPVVGSKHRLRCPPAWAIDARAFDEQIKPSASMIIIEDRETQQHYHASVATFDKLKGEFDRGFGRQYYLTLTHWTVEGNGHQQLRLWEEE